MVKGDGERDYYADLELSPSADANEVKKAFKKLGKGFGALVEAMPLPTTLVAFHLRFMAYFI